MQTSKVLVFVDEANLLMSAKETNRNLDWNLLRGFLEGRIPGYRIVETVVYVGLPPLNMSEWAEARTKKQKFVYWLRQNGFLVVEKDGAPRQDQNTFKANIDTLMALDALEFAVDAHPDVVILVTGDADFAHLAIKLRRRGIRVEVAALSGPLSNELRGAANGHIDLEPFFAQCEVLKPVAEGQEVIRERAEGPPPPLPVPSRVRVAVEADAQEDVEEESGDEGADAGDDWG